MNAPPAGCQSWYLPLFRARWSATIQRLEQALESLRLASNRRPHMTHSWYRVLTTGFKSTGALTRQ